MWGGANKYTIALQRILCLDNVYIRIIRVFNRLLIRLAQTFIVTPMIIVEEYCHAPKTHKQRGSNRAARKYMPARSGSARLNHNEHSLKDAIINKRVRWHEYRVPAPLTHTPTPQSNPQSNPRPSSCDTVSTKNLWIARK